MDITQLRYFQMIAETGSLTRAAQQLHISQPAMSAMLKKLEEELEVELFDRTPTASISTTWERRRWST